MRSLLLFAAIILTSAPLASAEVITFSGTTSSDSVTFQTEGGFTFGSGFPGAVVYDNFGNPGRAATANLSSEEEFQVPMFFTATRGGTFTFGGLDLSSFAEPTGGPPTFIQVFGLNHGTKLAEEDDTVTPGDGWTTEAAGPLTGLVLDQLEVVFWDSDEHYAYDEAIDNVILNPTAATATPEPSSVLLLGTGLAGLLRKRLS